MNSAAGDSHLLVVDDDVRLRALLQRYLTSNGYRVSAAADAAEARALMKSMAFDLLIVDVMMPGESGLDFTKAVRAQSRTPVLMLTARGEPEDRIAGLERGADDYLAKPFDFGELTARLRSALRRPALKELDMLRYADLAIDVQRRRVERSGEQIALTAREFDLLALLVRSPERVYTRSQLIDLVWGAERGVTPATVESYISYLRAKVDVPPRRRLIHTIRGVGYSVR